MFWHLWHSQLTGAFHEWHPSLSHKLHCCSNKFMRMFSSMPSGQLAPNYFLILCSRVDVPMLHVHDRSMTSLVEASKFAAPCCFALFCGVLRFCGVLFFAAIGDLATAAGWSSAFASPAISDCRSSPICTASAPLRAP